AVLEGEFTPPGSERALENEGSAGEGNDEDEEPRERSDAPRGAFCVGQARHLRCFPPPWISASPESIVVKMEPDIKWPSPRLVRTRRWSGELRAIRVDSTPSSSPEAADLAILSCFVIPHHSA